MKSPWPEGQAAALSLTYDDALPVHFQSVSPAFEARGLRATFYVPIRKTLWENGPEWARVAQAGHELGNHTVFHPCRKKFPGEVSWIDDAYDLASYSERRLGDELDLANGVLRLIDGRTRRTYGNTCHEMFFGRDDKRRSMEGLLAARFPAVRGAHRSEAIDPASPNFSNLGTRGADAKTFVQMKQELDALIAEGRWAIYCIHGVGKGTHGGFMETDEHLRLLDWLAAERSKIWTAPVLEVADHLAGRSSQHVL